MGKGCLKVKKSSLLTIKKQLFPNPLASHISDPLPGPKGPVEGRQRGRQALGNQPDPSQCSPQCQIFLLNSMTPYPKNPSTSPPLIRPQVQILRLLRILGRNHEESSEIMNDLLAQVGN